MMSKVITDSELIEELRPSSDFYHLAKTPLGNMASAASAASAVSAAGAVSTARVHPQMYALGFNTGGRPDGLWVSRGSTWIEKTEELDNPKYPLCCYVYRLDIISDNLLYIKTAGDFKKFDAEFSSYWLNLDYFEVDFIDYLTGAHIYSPKRSKLDLSKLRKRAGQSFHEILLSNKIIFNTSEEARTCCKFYNRVKLDIERFKYKDWAQVAEKYHGVIFDRWDITDVDMIKYLWFQSLDVASGCIWNMSAVPSVNLMYRKLDVNSWAAHIDI